MNAQAVIKNFCILRCSRTYQQRARIPSRELIGQLYTKFPPKTVRQPQISVCLHTCGIKTVKL